MIQVASDLHVDMARSFSEFFDNWVVAAPAIILAGDLAEVYGDDFGDAVRWFADNYESVFLVTGNHEYWGTSIRWADEFILDLECRLSNFHFCNQEVHTYKGSRILGATLWFEDPGKDTNWTDYRCIGDGYNAITERQKAERQFLEKELKQGDIVVTHHGPSYLSMDKQYVGSPINRYFYNNMDDFIKEKKPAYWIHGHTHCACRYFIDNTEVVCNPYGYPHEKSGYETVLIETKEK